MKYGTKVLYSAPTPIRELLYVFLAAAPPAPHEKCGFLHVICLQEADLGRDRDDFGNKPEYRETSVLLVRGNSAVGPIIMMRKSEGQAALTTCQDCEEAEAELECPECEMLYCPSCSRRIHSKGALARHGIKALEGPGQVARRTRDPGSIGAVGNGKGSGQWPGPDCDCQACTQKVTDGPCPAVLAVRNSNVSHVQPSGLPHTPSKLSAPRRVSAVLSCDENDENQPASKAVAKSEKQHWVRIHSGDGCALVLPVRLNADLAGGRCWVICPQEKNDFSVGRALGRGKFGSESPFTYRAFESETQNGMRYPYPVVALLLCSAQSSTSPRSMPASGTSRSRSCSR